jgi:hypothetical protein
MENETGMELRSKKSWVPWAILAVIIFLVLTGIYWLSSKTADPVYSAVYLDNGQVYFGELSQEILTNPYSIAENASGTPELVSISNSLIGPTNQIKLNESHVLYTETLASTSPVLKVIK